jgi:hypothetical protein
MASAPVRLRPCWSRLGAPAYAAVRSRGRKVRGVAQTKRSTAQIAEQAPIARTHSIGETQNDRLLVFQDEQRRDWTACTDFSYIARRHDIRGMDQEAFNNASGVISRSRRAQTRDNE